MSGVTATSVSAPRVQHNGGFQPSRSGGIGVLLALELRKLKGSSFWWMSLGMILLISAWSSMAFTKRASGSTVTRTLTLAQGEVYQLVGLLAPILAALLTSRLAVMETGGRMNLKWRSLGQGETGRFFAKLAVAAVTLSMCFIIPLAWIPLAAKSKGFTLDGGLATLILVPALIVFLSSIAVTAIQLTLSLTVSKQAVGLGVGVLAGLIGSGLGPMNVARLGWLFPAGISSAANPFLTTSGPDGYARMTLVANPWFQVGVSLLACIIWTVISATIIKVKESHQ